MNWKKNNIWHCKPNRTSSTVLLLLLLLLLLFSVYRWIVVRVNVGAIRSGTGWLELWQSGYHAISDVDGPYHRRHGSTRSFVAVAVQYPLQVHASCVGTVLRRQCSRQPSCRHCRTLLVGDTLLTTSQLLCPTSFYYASFLRRLGVGREHNKMMACVRLSVRPSFRLSRAST